MKRRDFFTTAAAAGVGLAISPINKIFGEGILNGKASDGEGLINVAVAISNGTTEIDFVGPCAAFESWHFDKVEKKYIPRFKIYTVSETLEPVSRRLPDYTFETAPRPAIVLIPAQQGSDALLSWLKKMHSEAELLMSVCTGARHLAAAGLLDGLSATTHHESIDSFSQKFPEVKWKKGVRFVEENKIATGGGLTAGIDLGLRIVERYFGREAALQVADHLEYQSKSWIVEEIKN